MPAASIRFEAGFGRPLDYYTGLVFDVRTAGLAEPLIGGGRYDRLMEMLGAGRPVPAVGFTMRLDHVDRGGRTHERRARPRAPVEGPADGGVRRRSSRAPGCRSRRRTDAAIAAASPATADVEVAFLSASEIARELASGNVHLGITGEDLVRETVADWEARIALLAGLGFGRADVVVAVPELWIDVWTMEDLDDVAAGFRARHGRRMRIATKYWNLTQGFFAAHGIALYRVVESLGATEGAPAAGTADLIVDITTTGATLAANHLKVLEDGVILKSEAKLAASRAAKWDAGASAAAVSLFKGLASAGVAIDPDAFSAAAAGG